MFRRRRAGDDPEQRRAGSNFVKPFGSTCYPLPFSFTRDEIAAYLNDPGRAVELKTYLAPPYFTYQDLASFLSQAQSQYHGYVETPRYAQSKTLMDDLERQPMSNIPANASTPSEETQHKSSDQIEHRVRCIVTDQDLYDVMCARVSFRQSHCAG